MTNNIKVLFTFVAILSLSACGGGSSQIVEGEQNASLVNGDEMAEQGADDVTPTNKVDVLAISTDGINGLGDDSLTGKSISKEEMIAKEEADRIEAEKLAEEKSKSYKPVVRFGYNASELSEESQDIIKFYSVQLNLDLTKNLTLKGHTDERGSPEYNLALGENRAKSAEELFMLFGVNQSRITLVSMGEEYPLIDEANEAAWAENRRVDIVISK